MKTHSNNVIVGSAIRFGVWCMVLIAFIMVKPAHGRTVFTSTGGTAGTPLNWRNPATWTQTGSGAPLVYIIRTSDYVIFDTSNSAPYIDTVLVNGFLVMGNNLDMTFTSTGAIGLIGTTSTISGGSNNSRFKWDGTSAVITGPYTAANIISNGPRYASASSTLAAGGLAQPSFVAGTLPITFGAFYAYCSGNEIMVHWSTEMEMGLRGFELLSSINGTKWFTIASIPTSGESYSTKYYSYKYDLQSIAVELRKGDSLGYSYFKLRAVENDGEFSELNSIKARCETAELMDKSQINISPNPSIGAPMLNVSSEQPGDFAVEIFNENGKLCKQYNFFGEFSEQVFTVIMTDLDPGIYRTRLVTPLAIKSTTFVKL